VNDKECLVANFWRAVQWAPEEVARMADWPINEADLRARHLWLVNEGRPSIAERVNTDPHFFDARVAAWWVWGLSCWIGSGWCAGGRKHTRPEINANKGVHSLEEQRGADDWSEPWKVRPHLTAKEGQGVNIADKRPILTGWSTKGVHAQMPGLAHQDRKGVHCKRPDLNNFANKDGKQQTGNGLVEWMLALATRLRRVRVCCGDWSRICTDAVVFNESPTAVFLDPPYGVKADRDAKLYNTDSLTVADDVREWALSHGSDKRLRIAYCSYGEVEMPKGWQRVYWKAPGGYGNQGDGRGRENRHRETIDFSPHCLQPEADLFTYRDRQGHDESQKP